MQNKLHHSAVIRRLIKNSLCESGLPAADLADEVAPWVRPATFYRALSTDQGIDPSLAEILVHSASSLAHQDAHKLWQVLDPSSPVRKPHHARELLDAMCVPAESLGAAFDNAAAVSKTLLSYYRILPPFLLDDDVNHKVVAVLAQRFSSDPSKTVPRLREEAERQREAFMIEGRLGNLRRVNVIMRLSDLLRMGLRLSPFTACSMDEIEAVLQSLLHDAVQERGVQLAFVNDIVPGVARQRAWPWSDWGAVMVFDGGLLLKRHRNTLTHRLLRSQDSAAAGVLHEAHRQELLDLSGYVCHGLETIQIMQFLEEFIAAITQQPVKRFWLN